MENSLGKFNQGDEALDKGGLYILDEFFDDEFIKK
jgi:hypothetical protein